MKLKEKLHLFLERMMMSNHEYLNMKNDAQNFKNVRGVCWRKHQHKICGLQR